MKEEKFIPASDVTDEGSYKIDMGDGDGTWLDITVYKRKGKLFLINPENNKECCLKGIHGWVFQKL
jgi:hypothetical protein